MMSNIKDLRRFGRMNQFGSHQNICRTRIENWHDSYKMQRLGVRYVSVKCFGLDSDFKYGKHVLLDEKRTTILSNFFLKF
jgi:hypothetical protein